MRKEEVKAEADTAMSDIRDTADTGGEDARTIPERRAGGAAGDPPDDVPGRERYRELKARWGQVFRADMGAEAFYELLQRLDLDQLASELWEEARTDTQQAAQEEGDQATQSGGSLPPFRQ